MTQVSETIQEFFKRKPMEIFAEEFLCKFESIENVSSLFKLTSKQIMALGVPSNAAVPLRIAIRESKTVKEFVEENKLDVLKSLSCFEDIDNVEELFEFTAGDWIMMGLSSEVAIPLHMEIQKLNPNKSSGNQGIKVSIGENITAHRNAVVNVTSYVSTGTMYVT